MQKVNTQNSQRKAWSRMVKALSRYCLQHGNCDVPANYKDNPSLGRWVSAQRHKKKVGELAGSRERDLDKIGFTWSPSCKSWEEMYGRLSEFKEKHGNCDVPTCIKEYKHLSRWVHRQRIRFRSAELSQDQRDRLDEVGFRWTSAGKGNKDSSLLIKPENVQKNKHTDSFPLQFGEKLYSLGNGKWVQYDGNGHKSEEIETYIAAHGGQEPPFIPLPKDPVEFDLGPVGAKPLKLHWEGSGSLPSLVLEFVRENGTLPRHDY